MSVSKLRSKISSPVLFIMLPLTLSLTACAQKYSPDTYSSSAVQQASKVESGVVVGVRKVSIRADPSIATATGAAAGGIAGSQVAEGAVSALSALGGAVVGGIAGSEAGHQVQDTFGFEYIVRNAKGDLLSVTQKDTTPLKIGQRVLLIQGSQARIVNDYTEHVEPDPASADKPDMSKSADKQQGDIKPPAPAAETDTQKMLNAATAAATAAALAAITAEGTKSSDGNSSAPADAAAAASAAVTPDAAANAAPKATPAPEEEPATDSAVAAAPVANKTDESKTAQSKEGPVKANPGKEAETPATEQTAVSPKPGEQAVPAPASTIVVALPAETKPDAAKAKPDPKAAKHKAADGDKEADGDEPDDKGTEPSDDGKSKETAPEQPDAPAKPDDAASH